jgi:hypothetical protein
MPTPRLSRGRPPRRPSQEKEYRETLARKTAAKAHAETIKRVEDIRSKPSSSVKSSSLFKRLFSRKSGGGKKSRKIKTRRTHRKKTYRKRK